MAAVKALAVIAACSPMIPHLKHLFLLLAENGGKLSIISSYLEKFLGNSQIAIE